MAVTYATPQFKFVDSQYGTAAAGGTGVKVNVPLIHEVRYHKRAQKKTIFQRLGMIGEDAYADGSIEQTQPGFPIIRKTDFQAKKGDTLIMHQRTNLATTNNVGQVGGGQLIDAEVGWDLNYKKVKIEQWMQGVLTGSGMNEQRSPFSESFVQTEEDLLSDWQASVIDNGILYAAHYGRCPHLFRQYGHTNLVPAAVSNTLFGNDLTMDTTRTIANIDGTGADNPKAITFDIIDTYCRQNDFDPVMVEGEPYWLVLQSPMANLKLRDDDKFRNAMQYAQVRGDSNPLFKHARYIYGNCIIYDYDKIRTLLAGYNPAGLTVASEGTTSSAITEASYTGIGGGVTAAQLHNTYVFGANALALAEGRFKMAQRIEDSYQQLIGRAADGIWAVERMDWLNAAGVASNNQSMLRIVNTLV